MLTSTIHFPTKITDIPLIIQNPTIQLNSPKQTFYQNQDIIICYSLQLSQEAKEYQFQNDELGILKYSNYIPKILISTSKQILSGIFIDKSDLLTVDKTIVNSETHRNCERSIGEFEEILNGKNCVILTISKYFILFLIRHTIHVEEKFIGKQLHLRVSLIQKYSVDKRKKERDILYLENYQNEERGVCSKDIIVYQPLEITQKLRENVFCLTVSNKINSTFKLNTLSVESKLLLNENTNFDFPIVLDAYESYTFVFILNFPIPSSNEDCNEWNGQRSLSPNVILSPRGELELNESKMESFVSPKNSSTNTSENVSRRESVSNLSNNQNNQINTNNQSDGTPTKPSLNLRIVPYHPEPHYSNTSNNSNTSINSNNLHNSNTLNLSTNLISPKSKSKLNKQRRKSEVPEHKRSVSEMGTLEDHSVKTYHINQFNNQSNQNKNEFDKRQSITPQIDDISQKDTNSQLSQFSKSLRIPKSSSSSKTEYLSQYEENENVHHINQTMEISFELTYSTNEMIGSLSEHLTYFIDIPVYNFIYVKYNLPEHIYANNLFEIQYVLHYNSFKWRHLLMVHTSSQQNKINSLYKEDENELYNESNGINDNDEIDCLHPSIDVGVYSQPTTITVNISYMAGKAGVFVLPKIEFRETRSGEVFPIKDYCTIVVEDD